LKNLYQMLAATALLSALTGCGSVLATLEVEPINTDPGKRSVAQQVLDESIETKAVVNLRAHNTAFDKAKFVVVAYNGYVLIAGEVASPDMVSEAAEVLRDIDGVRRIYNELIVGPKSTAQISANDAWLTTKVKTALLTHANTPALRVKVVTENSVVYLMGLLTPTEAKRAEAVAAEVAKVTKVVALFELI